MVGSELHKQRVVGGECTHADTEGGECTSRLGGG